MFVNPFTLKSSHEGMIPTPRLRKWTGLQLCSLQPENLIYNFTFINPIPLALPTRLTAVQFYGFYVLTQGIGYAVKTYKTARIPSKNIHFTSLSHAVNSAEDAGSGWLKSKGLVAGSTMSSSSLGATSLNRGN